jgi:hypothetical protein
MLSRLFLPNNVYRLMYGLVLWGRGQNKWLVVNDNSQFKELSNNKKIVIVDKNAKEIKCDGQIFIFWKIDIV